MFFARVHGVSGLGRASLPNPQDGMIGGNVSGLEIPLWAGELVVSGWATSPPARNVTYLVWPLGAKNGSQPGGLACLAWRRFLKPET